MINLLKITIRNFRSVGDIPVVLDYTELGGLNLVYSDANGSGKTTVIVQALIFALTKKAYNDKSKLSNLVNLKNKKNTLVDLEFSKAGVVYRVRRGISPNIFEIYNDGVLIPQDTNYQEILNAILDYVSFYTLVDSLILSTSRYTPFRSMKKDRREEFIDTLFKTYVYTPMVSTNAKDISDVRSKLYDVEFNERLLIQKKDSLLETINVVNKSNKELADLSKEELQSLVNEYKFLLSTTQNTDYHIKTLNDELTVLFSNRQILDSQLTQMLTKVNNELVVLKAKEESLTGDICSVCQSPLTADHIQAHLSDIKFKYHTVSTRSSSIIDTLKTKLVEVDTKISHLQEELQGYKDTKIRITGEISIISKRINQIKSSINTGVDVSIYTSQLSDVELELLGVSNNKQTLLDRLSILLDAQVFLKNVNLRKEIVNSYLPLINKLLNECLAKMEFFVTIELTLDYDITVTSVSKQGLSIYDLSDGEQNKVDLAFVIVWKKIMSIIGAGSINLFVLDETLSRFSTTSVVDFISIIKEELPEYKTVVILQHPNDFIEYFDKVLKFSVEDEYTKFEFVD